MKKVFYFLSICFLLSSCDKTHTPRVYLEKTMEEEISSSAIAEDKADPHSGFSKEQLTQMLKESASQPTEISERLINWSVPEQWEERPVNGMRIASFTAKEDPAAIDCSIVTLGSGAGGLSANIVRWLGQLNLPVPPQSELNIFIEKLEKISLNDNITGLMVNLSSFQKDAVMETPSMIAVIIDIPEQRIFVKLTGTKANIIKNLVPFKSLVHSLEFH